MHSSCMLREGARPEIVRDNMGHVEYRRDPELPATERRSWMVQYGAQIR
jgi:hypothetical protein